MMEFRKSVEEFWPLYVNQHSKPWTRRLHFVATLSLLLCLLSAALLFSPWPLAAAPVVGYGFAWTSHFLVERNRPLTFAHPVLSFLCDLKMFGLMLTGRMDREIKRLGKRPVLYNY